MNRRSILKLLGLAPVAAPAVAAAARATTEAASVARAYGVSMEIEGQATALGVLTTRIPDDWDGRAHVGTLQSEPLLEGHVAAIESLRTLEISHLSLTCSPVAITRS